MDIVFTDSSLPMTFLNEVMTSAREAFGSQSNISEVVSNDGDEAWKQLEELKSSGFVGSFAIVSSKSKLESFKKTFPNNTIEVSNLADSSEPKRIFKQVAWMLNNFGREKKEKKMTSNTWIISDTHFYHDNIIKYCDRPYANSQEMNEDLISKWNAVVGKDDIIWHLGDFCFGSRNHVREILLRLNGRVNLVMGNHDHHKVNFYYGCGFHRVYDHPVVVSNFFILSHEPMQWVKDGDVYANIYGHIHDQKQYRDFTSNTFCACVERTGYAPVRWTDMIEKMKSFSSSEDK